MSGFNQRLINEVAVGVVFVFKGRRYLRYSNVTNGPDAGYPKWINSGWMPFPRA